ncbi:PLD6 [Cordylochernes scorpioides]|uniref:Mitochondrial cardiolipin hydrolase n=1 Tax=Cordylochernes scorpioides TaxID=51811 RepID=A0ABY6K0B4_9ARAC|nr:PLD6 [Cordylochernes scorpioides]
MASITTYFSISIAVVSFIELLLYLHYRKRKDQNNNQKAKYEVIFYPDGSKTDVINKLLMGPSTQRFVDILEQASKSLDVCVYLIMNPMLADILVTLSKEKGVLVRLITDASNTGEQCDVEYANVGQLRRAGIEVRTNQVEEKVLLHHKFVIVDGKTFLGGSFNWSMAGTTRNFENVIITTDVSVVKPYQDQFNNLWNQYHPDNMPPVSPDLSPIEHVWDLIGRRLRALPQPRSEDELWLMVEREWTAIPQDIIESVPRHVAACIAKLKNENKAKYEVLNYPDGTKTDFSNNIIMGPSTSRLVEVLQQATKSVDVCVYLITNPMLADILVKLSTEKGVLVRMITDASNTGEQCDVYGSQIGQLRRAGIEVRTKQVSEKVLLHHKFAIVDGKTFLGGSYNWSLAAATSNFENLIITTDVSVVKPYQNQFNNLWNQYHPDNM